MYFQRNAEVIQEVNYKRIKIGMIKSYWKIVVSGIFDNPSYYILHMTSNSD